LHEGFRLSFLFSYFAAAGIDSLEHLTEVKLAEIFEELDVTPRTHRLFIDYVRDIAVFADNGLISRPWRFKNPQIKTREIAEEVGAHVGAATLSESETAYLLGLSEQYIELAAETATKVRAFREGGIGASELRAWAYEKLPVARGLALNWIAEQLGWLIRISIYHLIAFHFGSRASEALSANLNSLFSKEKDDGSIAAFVALTIFKNSKQGTVRTYPAHPYFLLVSRAAQAVAAAMDHPNDAMIFSQANPYREISINDLNHKLRRFAWMHGRTIEFSSHSWRFTLADVVAGSAEKPFPAIQYQLGHKRLSQAIAYGMHGPQGSQIKQAAVQAGMASVESFLERCKEQTDIGGVIGAAIAATLREGTSVEDLKSQMVALSIVPLSVGDNRVCVKQTHVRGACSAVTNDSFPEIEHCRGDCTNQVQFEAVLEDWGKFIKDASSYYANDEISVFDKIRKTHMLMQDVAAWPQLRVMIDDLILSDPGLRKWFDQNDF